MMTQEDRNLLLKDLCARVPYKVKVRCIIDFSYEPDVFNNKDIIEFIPKEFAIDTHGFVEYIEDNDEFDSDTQNAIQEHLDLKVVTIENLTTYLRPMKNMTVDELKELSNYDNSIQRTDFFYSHHIDVRNLIEKGFALEAPEGMYKI